MTTNTPNPNPSNSTAPQSRVTSSGLDTSIKLQTEAVREPMGLTLQNLRLGSDGRVSLDASLNLNEALTFKFLAEDGRYEPGKVNNSYGQVGVELRDGPVQGSFLTDLVNGPLILAQGVCGLGGGLSAGASMLLNTKLDAGYDTSGASVLDAGVAAKYTAADWSSTVRSTGLFSGIHAAYEHRVNPFTQVGTSVEYSLVTSAQTIAVGTRHELDGQESVLKVRADSQAKMAVSYKQRLTPILAGTVCVEMDVLDWGPENQKIGMRLAFEPK